MSFPAVYNSSGVPGNLSTNVTYYSLTTGDPEEIQLAASQGGQAIDIMDDGPDLPAVMVLGRVPLPNGPNRLHFKALHFGDADINVIGIRLDAGITGTWFRFSDIFQYLTPRKFLALGYAMGDKFEIHDSVFREGGIIDELGATQGQGLWDLTVNNVTIGRSSFNYQAPAGAGQTSLKMTGNQFFSSDQIVLEGTHWQSANNLYDDIGTREYQVLERPGLFPRTVSLGFNPQGG